MDKPKYQVVIEELREEINSKGANESFYSERELAKIKNISRMTARKVIDILVDESLLYRVVNVGTFVVDKHLTQKDISTFSLTNKKLKFKKIYHSIKNAEVDLAEKLGIGFLETVLVSTYVSYLDDKIYSIEEVFIKYEHNEIFKLFNESVYNVHNNFVDELVVRQKLRATLLPIKYLPWMKVDGKTPVIETLSECYTKEGKKQIVCTSYTHPNNFNFYIK